MRASAVISALVFVFALAQPEADANNADDDLGGMRSNEFQKPDASQPAGPAIALPASSTPLLWKRLSSLLRFECGLVSLMPLLTIGNHQLEK